MKSESHSQRLKWLMGTLKRGGGRLQSSHQKYHSFTHADSDLQSLPQTEWNWRAWVHPTSHLCISYHLLCNNVQQPIYHLQGGTGLLVWWCQQQWIFRSRTFWFPCTSPDLHSWATRGSKLPVHSPDQRKNIRLPDTTRICNTKLTGDSVSPLWVDFVPRVNITITSNPTIIKWMGQTEVFIAGSLESAYWW